MKTEMVMDACTAILLAKATVLETASNTYEINMTDYVFAEIMEGKPKMFQDALLVERLNKEKKIAVIKYDNGQISKIGKDFNMAKGEASTVAAGIKNNCAIATDNKQGRKAAQTTNMPLVGSIEIVVSLFGKNKISREKAVTALKTLQEEGWFDNYLIEKAMEDLK